jgi:hypothetical protein
MARTTSTRRATKQRSGQRTRLDGTSGGDANNGSAQPPIESSVGGGARWSPGVAPSPDAQKIVERLVWKAEHVGPVRAATLLAATAATLCLDHDGADGRSLDDHLAALAQRDDVADFLRGVLVAVTAHVWNGPTLLAPLIDALEGQDARASARLVMETLAQARVGDFIAGRDPFASDLLGMLHTETRSKSSVRGAGAYYTPENITLCMALMVRVQEGESVLDPCVGTGGMFLGAARAMRRDKGRPHRCMWTGVDIDPLAIACAAVNAFVWMLGPFVRLVVANALTFDLSTLPAPDDVAFEPIVRAWNLRAFATWSRRGASAPDADADADVVEADVAAAEQCRRAG